MEAVEAITNHSDAEWHGAHPSLFGLYAPLDLDGPEANIDLGLPAAVAMKGGAHSTPVLKIASNGKVVEVSLPVSSDSPELRNRLMSRWMGENFSTLPTLSLERVLSLLISQATPTPMPVWLNASIRLHQWEAILSHALEADDSTTQAMRVVQGLACDSCLLARLRWHGSASTALLGLEGAMEGAKVDSIDIVRKMVERIATAPGVLLVTERGGDAEERDAILEMLNGSGWLALVGQRPLERHAKRLARTARIPTILLDSDKMKSTPVLAYIDKIISMGDIDKMGVMRQRAIGMVTSSKES